MGLTSRHYIFPEDGSLKRVPRRIADSLVFGHDAIPEYAGTRQKVATALVRNEESRPVALLDIHGSYWTFDDEGRIDKGLNESISSLLDFAFDHERPASKVVSLVPVLKKKRHREQHRWEPTKDDYDRIAADIWPGINGPVEDVTSVKGEAPKRPPLTSSAKHSLSEIRSHLSSIGFELEKLSEPGLKGLAFELRRNATFDRDSSLWIGVAEETERQLEIQRRRRTGRGTWYAVIEACTERVGVNDRHIVDLHVLAHEKCANKSAAVEATRRLLKQHADAFGDRTTIEAYVTSELEWSPDTDD